MPNLAILLAVLLLSACAARPTWIRPADPASAPAALVIRDARLFAGDDTGLRGGRWDIWVEGERIARVLPATTPVRNPAIREIDAAGAVVMPGLIDGHVHVGSTDSAPWALRLPDPKANLERFLRAGLTTVIDLGGDPELLAALRDDLATGELQGPDLVYAGLPFAHRDGHPATMVRAIVPWPFKNLAARRMGRHPDDVTEIVEAIAELRDAGATKVKVMIDSIPLGVPQLDDATLRAIVRGAHAADLPVLAHVGGNAEAERALAAGVDLFGHNIYREPISAAVVRALAEQGVPVVVTIGVWDAVDDLAQAGPPPLPLEAILTDQDWRREVRGRPEGWTLEAFTEWLGLLHATRGVRLANAAALKAGGVTILVGSDSPNVGWPAGAAFHAEMLKLEAAGLTPGEILRAATSINAGAFGLADRGIVAEGRRADLLLIDGDPTADLAALERLLLVIRAGRPVEFVR